MYSRKINNGKLLIELRDEVVVEAESEKVEVFLLVVEVVEAEVDEGEVVEEVVEDEQVEGVVKDVLVKEVVGDELVEEVVKMN